MRVMKEVPGFSNYYVSEDGVVYHSDKTPIKPFKSNKSFDNLVQLIQNDRIINLTNPNIDRRSTNATTTEREQLVNFRPQSPIILKNHNIQLNIKNSSSKVGLYFCKFSNSFNPFCLFFILSYKKLP